MNFIKKWWDRYLINKRLKEIDIDGITGFIIPDNPLAISALVNHLIYNRYKKAVEIGQNGKKLAQELFSKDRYDKQWLSLIRKVVGR